MRKIIIISNVWLMALLLIISMTGCAQDTSSSIDPFLVGNTGAISTAPGNVSLGGVSDLKASAGYVILAKTGVSTVPTSVVTGYVGLSPNARVGLTGFSLISEPVDRFFSSAQVVEPYKLFAADMAGGTAPADLTSAVLSMQTAYTDAAGRAPGVTELGGGTLAGLTLVPGVYKWAGNVTITTNLTLDGPATGVWIFQIGGTLDMDAAMSVILAGGALPENIFWQVADVVTFGAGTHFEGVILAQTQVIFGNLSSIKGRVFAQTAVTLDATTVTQP